MGVRKPIQLADNPPPVKKEIEEPSGLPGVDRKLLRRWLDRVPFFKPFDSSFLDAIAVKENVFYRFKPEEYIIHEGEQDNQLYVILKGTVKITKNIRPRGEVEMAKLNEGTMFGEMSFLRQGERTSNVLADSNVIVMKINPEMVSEMDLNVQVKFKDQLLKLVVRRFENLSEKFARLMSKGGFVD